MGKNLIVKNAPEILLELGSKWAKEKSFYLGPENMFMCNNIPVKYKFDEDIVKDYGTWCIHTDDFVSPNYFLSSQEMREIQKVLLLSHSPENINIHFDYHCNHKCVMCPFHGPNKNKYWENNSSMKRILSIEEAYNIVDKAMLFKPKTFNIASTGDIFTYHYWHEICDYVSKKGCGINLITNGCLIDEDKAKKLASLNIASIQVSLNAFSYETYAAVSGVTSRKSYERSFHAPELLQKYGLPIVVSYVYQNINIHELADFLLYFKNRRIDVHLQARIDDFQGFNNTPIMGMCEHSFSTIAIQNNGRILPCSAMPYLYDDLSAEIPQWNIFDVSGINVYRDMVSKVMEDKSFYEFCAHCPYYSNSAPHYVNAWGYNAHQTAAGMYDFGFSNLHKSVLKAPLRYLKKIFCG